jgi:hypothetical protein
VVPDGSGYNDEGEPAKDELALNAARLRAFGSQAALDPFTALWADRAALGNAVDQLAEHVETFTKIVRRELDAD